jgi:aspartate kinase
VAEKIRESHTNNNQVVVVVSARAGVTDRLISDAKKLSQVPKSRELDALLCVGEQETAALLAIALNEIGIRAASQLAFQVGIRTCSSHGNARIKNIDAENIERLLSEKNVVVVAGFQGITENGDLTTLGRGGSDLTALALSHRLKADRCEIYTDVDGVYTGNPRIIKNAKLIEEIDSESLMRLSFAGNEIMQDRSVAFAKKNNIPFKISNTFSKSKGTNVVARSRKYESCIVGVTGKTNLCLISCESDRDMVYGILSFFNSRGVDVVFVKQRRIDGGGFFCEISTDMYDFADFSDEFFQNYGGVGKKFTVVKNLSRVDVVGTNVQASPKGVAIFGEMRGSSVHRSEYGKHGVSFFVGADDHDYESLLNKVHDFMFNV